MRRIALTMLPITLLMSTAGGGQSLGDVARQNREKQKARNAPAASRVITSDDIPASPAANADASKDEGKKGAAPVASADKLSAEQWKSLILAQKNAIAKLQAQIDKLNDSIHFVEANAYYNGVQHNERQVLKQQLIAQMLQQLEQQKKRLAEMQEAARQGGMGSAVYDP